MKKPLTIILTGGGSGGHITPLLSLAHALKKVSPGCRVVYIGLKGESFGDHLSGRYQVFDEALSVPSGKFRRYHGETVLSQLIDLRTLALNTRDFFRVIVGIKAANNILKRLKPDIVFSKGGFVAVPVGLAARRLSLPIITHDSDTVPGLANRIVGRFAKIHATGMPAGYYSYPPESIHYVGVPIDERIKPITADLQKKFKKELGFPPGCLVLTVGGAGHGAVDVNNMILAIAPELLQKFPNLYILHIAGKAHEAEVSKRYQALEESALKRVNVLGFTPDFYMYTGAADLVITRAGATTIAELAVQAKPVILIPAPHLTGGHQLKNAAELVKHQAAVVVDNNAPPNKLFKEVSDILASAVKRQQMTHKIGALAKGDAADKLAELLIQTAQQRRGVSENER